MWLGVRPFVVRCALMCALAGSWAASPALAGVSVGSAPALPAGTRPLAGVAAAAPMRVTVVLRPRSTAGLSAYASAVGDPGSPLFRRYLSVAAFRVRFAPRPSVIAGVEASLRAHGLTPGRVSANGLSIPVTATTGAIERAFSLVLARVALPSGGREVVNTSAPLLDAAVAADVQAVIGLSSLDHPVSHIARAATAGVRPSARRHVATGGPQPCAAATSAAGPQSAYTTDQIASSYGFGGLYRAGDFGLGQTVALYELEPNDPSDIAGYQACYGTHASVSYVQVDGGAGPAGPGSGEAAFDIEQVIGFAPKARILVYQGPNTTTDNPGSGAYDTMAAIVNQDQAQVVSTSWGQCEPAEGATDAGAKNTLFMEAAAQGQTIVSAAGDQGAQDCDVPGSVPDIGAAVDDPASQPFVTGVGGTSLSGLGPPPSETVWNNGGAVSGLLGSNVAPGASGGGISTLWPMPAYQRAAATGLGVIGADSTSTPCHANAGDCRQVPDVSASADPVHGYLIYYNASGSDSTSPSGWQGIGGTSGGAPLWAAIVALANADPACAGVPLGFVDPALYRVAGASHASFNDITSGNNDYTGTNGGRFAARAGYDEASGLGTPKVSALAPALCRLGLRFAAPIAAESFRGVATAYLLSASDGPGAGLHYVVTGLPAGLRAGTVSGRVTGHARRLGVSHVTVQALDATGGIRVAHLTWTVAAPPRVVRAVASGVRSGRPALTVAVATGRLGAALQSLVVSLPPGLRAAAVRRRLSIAGPGGRHLGWSATVRGGRVTVTLRVPATRVTLVLRPGALVDSGPAVGAVRLVVSDVLGGVAPLVAPVSVAS